MTYAIEHNGIAYGPDGKIKDTEGTALRAEDVAAYNKALEEQEIAWLKTAPEKVFLYVRMPKDTFKGPGNVPQLSFKGPEITTFLGTCVSATCWVGPRRDIGFGWHSYRRAVSAKIFGTLYHGWYMESSGEYCRLKRAKKQSA